MQFKRLPQVLPNMHGCGTETHRLLLPECCPVSHNPRPGSVIEIIYRPEQWKLEVGALAAYIHQYKDGLTNEQGDYIVRDMEAMIAFIAQHCADVLGVPVTVKAYLNIVPRQEIDLSVKKNPLKGTTSHGQTQFWKLIDTTRIESNDNGKRQVELIKQHLRTLSLEEIITFECIFYTLYAYSWTEPLEDAFAEAYGYYSGDGFDYFRPWLITRGEAIFRSVIQHPDQITTWNTLDTLEDLTYAAREVYEEKTGKHLYNDEILTEDDAASYPFVGYEWLLGSTKRNEL